MNFLTFQLHGSSLCLFSWSLWCLHSFCTDGILWFVSSFYPSPLTATPLSPPPHEILPEPTTGSLWPHAVFFWYHKPFWLPGIWYTFRYLLHEPWPPASPIWVIPQIRVLFWTNKHYLCFYHMNLCFVLNFQTMALKSNCLLELPKELCKTDCSWWGAPQMNEIRISGKDRHQPGFLNLHWLFQ